MRIMRLKDSPRHIQTSYPSSETSFTPSDIKIKLIFSTLSSTEAKPLTVNSRNNVFVHSKA